MEKKKKGLWQKLKYPIIGGLLGLIISLLQFLYYLVGESWIASLGVAFEIIVEITFGLSGGWITDLFSLIFYTLSGILIGFFIALIKKYNKVLSEFPYWLKGIILGFIIGLIFTLVHLMMFPFGLSDYLFDFLSDFIDINMHGAPRIILFDFVIITSLLFAITFLLLFELIHFIRNDFTIKIVNWQKINSWKNWLLVGAIIGFVFILLFKFVIALVSIVSSGGFGFYSYILIFSFVYYKQLLIYVLAGVFIAGILKFIKENLKDQIKIIMIIIVLILAAVLISIDLKPLTLYSHLHQDNFIFGNGWTELAISTKDIDFCYYRLDDLYRSECLYNVIIQKAIAKQNENICNTLERESAYKGGDAYAYFAKCLTEVAKLKKDETLCEPLSDSWRSVRYECYRDVAINKSDLNICPEGSLEDRDICYKDILSNSNHPLLLCGNLKVGSLFRCYKSIDCSKEQNKESCIQEVDSYLEDLTLCQIEEKRDDKNECYFDYAMKYNNPDSCMKMEGLDASVPCLSQLAITNNNISLCILNGYTIYYGCYKNFVEQSNDVNICLNITGIGELASCVRYFSILDQNISFCGLIDREDFRQECYDKYENKSRTQSLSQ